ncbi:hypothetical protein LTS08_001989 [Lithohypha guttulata]|nr:hypothetical protein LTS08_001989 [Lithohypha guttulata]
MDSERITEQSADSTQLPSPEAEILKSAMFMHFKVSGGPHMDALLYNQATIMKMVQDIRLMQSRGLGKCTVGSDDQVEMDVDTPTTSIEFAKEVKEMMADEEIKPLLINLLGKWMANDKPKNTVAGNRRNKNLAA